MLAVSFSGFLIKYGIGLNVFSIEANTIFIFIKRKYRAVKTLYLIIDTALEAGHKIRMIKPQSSRYDTSARVHYHIGDIEKAFAYAQ